MDIQELVLSQRRFFQSGVTKDIHFRLAMLKKLDTALHANEKLVMDALKADLNKSVTESYLSEVGIVYEEIRYFLHHTKRLTKPKRVATPIKLFAATSYRMAEPFGNVLIMSPWNYPFQLAIVPLIGAIAAGNTAIVKPASYTPTVSQAIATILSAVFPPEYIAVVLGGRLENQALLEQRFDYIFFTGSSTVGRLVMEKASRYLTPVTLELGGKSPCIVDSIKNIPLTARRIAFGKFLNAGQTCVAPDYCLVEQSLMAPLVAAIKTEIVKFFGASPLTNPDFPKIVNQGHVDRLNALIAPETILVGGLSQDGRIEPTLLGPVSPSAPIMQEEIFGPILPIIPYTDRQEVFRLVLVNEKPLALYLFTDDKNFEKEVVERLSFGGATINDTIMHFASGTLGFGGVGASGMGRYHGVYSFETFSHYKGVLKRAQWIDLAFRYHPYTKSKEDLLRTFIK
jgi:aldehyde dehydrogenase (NAD+)